MICHCCGEVLRPKNNHECKRCHRDRQRSRTRSQEERIVQLERELEIRDTQEIIERDEANRVASDGYRKPALINHLDLFRRVLNGSLKLSNDRDAGYFGSWKVGGQDFYVYAQDNDQVLTSEERGL